MREADEKLIINELGPKYCSSHVAYKVCIVDLFLNVFITSPAVSKWTKMMYWVAD